MTELQKFLNRYPRRRLRGIMRIIFDKLHAKPETGGGGIVRMIRPACRETFKEKSNEREGQRRRRFLKFLRGINVK